MHRRRQPLGIVSMTRSGHISSAVRDCFVALNCELCICPWFTENLYEIIKSSPITHWFFTGNSHDFVTDPDPPTIDRRIYGIRTKLMFYVCYSHQLLCYSLGTPVHTAERRIDGEFPLIRMKKDKIWRSVSEREPFMGWYKQYAHCTQPPRDWTVIARLGGHIAAMRRGNNYSFQVHPERRAETFKILENWLEMLPPIIESAESFDNIKDWLRNWSFFNPEAED